MKSLNLQKIINMKGGETLVSMERSLSIWGMGLSIETAITKIVTISLSTVTISLNAVSISLNANSIFIGREEF